MHLRARNLLSPMRANLGRKASAIIIGMCALVGIAATWGGATLVRKEERARVELSLSQLIETIDRTARIAAFTADATLAEEVAAGLRRNRFVSHVAIYAGMDLLVDTGASRSAGTPLIRPLVSPFDEQELVGRIVITPDAVAIDQHVARIAEGIAVLLAMMAAALATAVAWVVEYTVTRPIKAVSDALHRLDTHAGERLVPPAHNDANELGRLVADVNTLVDRIERRERIFRTIVGQAMDAITLIDIRTDRFVEYNESAHADLGLSRIDFGTLSARDLLLPRHSEHGAQDGANLWTNRVYEIRCATAEGSRVDLRVSTRLISLDGQPHVVCCWTNVTSQKAAQEELRQHRDGLQHLVAERTRDLREAKDAAEQANRAKSEFLSNMSHELRTPMHAVLSFARLGDDRAEKAPPTKLRHYFRSILTSGQRLLTLLNDLLDLSKLEAGMMELNPGREELARIAHQVMEEFAPLAAEKRLRLSLISDVEDTHLVCDAVRLHQVLNNLLSNAVKFTPADHSVDLRIGAALLPGDVPALALSVRDQGVGIPEAELEAVFDKFVQSSKTSSGAGGTGLGLSITREIVALHGGTITASNNPEGGACFTVLLPRAAATAAVPA